MYETDVMVQAHTLAQLAGVSPAEFQHVKFGGDGEVPAGDEEVVLASVQIKKNEALVITSILLGSVSRSVAGLEFGLDGSSSSFLPFFSTNGSNSSSFGFLRLDGVPLIPEAAIIPFVFGGPCLHVIGTGFLTLGLMVVAPPVANTVVTSRVYGFKCTETAVTKLRDYQTHYISSF